MLNIDGRLLEKLNANEYYLFSVLLNYGKKSRPKNSVLCRKTGWGIEKVQKIKKSLESKGVLKIEARKNKERGGKDSNCYNIITSLASKYNGNQIHENQIFEIQIHENQILEFQIDDFQIVENQTDYKVLKLSIIESIKLLKDKDIVPSKEETPIHPFGEKLFVQTLADVKTLRKCYSNLDEPKYKYLNDYLDVAIYFIEKTKKSIRVKVKAHLIIKQDYYTGLAARFKEGFSVDDCKKIIDSKCNQWLNDKKMNSSLNMTTLFRKSHFERYLDEADNNPEPTTNKNYKPSYFLPTFDSDQERLFFFINRFEEYKKHVKDKSHANTTLKKRAIYQKEAEQVCYELEQQYPNFAQMEIKWK